MTMPGAEARYVRSEEGQRQNGQGNSRAVLRLIGMLFNYRSWAGLGQV